MYSWGRIVNSLTKILGSIGWGGSQPSKYWKIYWYGLAQQVWGKYMASIISGVGELDVGLGENVVHLLWALGRQLLHELGLIIHLIGV